MGKMGVRVSATQRPNLLYRAKIKVFLHEKKIYDAFACEIMIS